jgi:UDP-3-O-[3-hydroxymyristoyl] N-acetylglucosamine deacetylase
MQQKHASMQQTIANNVHFTGVGLHNGKDVQVTIYPTTTNKGIIFKRLDIQNKSQYVSANFRQVSKASLNTTVSNKDGVSVSTIEHLMSALWACGIDNALVSLDNSEIPIMDGSAAPFIKLITEVGTITQKAKRKFIVIKKRLEIEQDGQQIVFSPANDLSVECTINFEHQTIGRQKYTFYKGDKSSFVREISEARTFGFRSDLEKLHQIGLAKGATLENCVGLDEDGVLNKEGLRFKNEFVRHKILDCVGDLFLAGARVLGHVKASKTSHAMHHTALRTLFSSDANYELV